MIFHVLGPLEVQGTTGERHRLGRGKAATVLATLLLHPNAWITSEKLIEATWQEAAVPVSAAANLKTYVWRARRVLRAAGAGPRIESAPGCYRLRLAPGELDTDHVAERVAHARAAVRAGQFTTAIDAFGAALRWWRGCPFEGVDVGWEADRLSELRACLREELAEAQLAAGRFAAAAGTLRALTDDDALRETAWAGLVRALAGAGRRVEAVCAYGEAARMLAGELGTDPGEALTAAYRLALDDPVVPAAAESVRVA